MKKNVLMKRELHAVIITAFVLLCIQSGQVSALEMRIRNDFNNNMYIIFTKSLSNGEHEDGEESSRALINKVSIDSSVKVLKKTTYETPTHNNAPDNSTFADEIRLNVDELLNLINAERRKTGTPDLILDETMQKAANRRACELTKKYSHKRPDGRNYSTVFTEFDLDPIISAENIAWRSGNGNSDMTFFHKAFMESPGHRANMLNREFSIVGLGIIQEGNTCYVVELFAGYSTMIE